MDTYSKARRIHSTHFDERPDPADISLLVIHNISLPPGEFGGTAIRDLFTGQLDCSAHPFYEQLQGVRVSAHCVIYRNGSIEQYVPFTARAWHAGLSSFQGRSRCNDYAIGIELEGTDCDSYTDKQYQSLIALSQDIQAQYPAITLGRIVGHSDIAPGRKTDPGPAFDWSRYRQALAQR
ncbi:1,6-anhydro-N-acetylmuramyl-L-alanine amidase AmpD [Alteromonas halophila]|uniref:1,6-anhydro-N-acetylmuramyl-L-alanine amidase AmpD n=1 Tax=Alteromonas halophila TaxID=516698 RepID=A0A918JPI0_9ALTE|nr:1,6-anhydro-N-acetylmuramyl-L-alanine amidase AmpD [Alteromonas halophila]GGW94006.1 N-acetyl-anhydromuranmyl-L-alanine amidase [Alteromonas halophila]